MPIDRVKVRANAEKLLRANKIQEAIRELMKLAEDNPRDIQVLNQIGNLYLRVGNTDAAVPMFIKVAELFAKSGFATKAVASLKIVTREQPDNLSAWQMLANLSEQQGFAREALSAWDKVGELVARSGNLESAIQIQRKLLELEPENLKARVQLGDSLVRLGKKDEGIKHYLKAAAQLSGQGHMKEAARMYERAIELDPNALGALEGAVKGHISQHHPEAALLLVDTLLERKPTLEAFLLLKVEVLTEMRQLAPAEQLCQKLLAAHPGNLAILSRLIRLLVADKKLPEALARLEAEAAKAAPGQMGDVATLYEEVIRFAPDQVPLLKGLCSIYRKQRNNARLSMVLAEVANRATSQGLFNDAHEALREMVQLDPTNPRYREDLRSIEAKHNLLAPAVKPAPAVVPPAPPQALIPPAPETPPEEVVEPGAPSPIDLEVEVEQTGADEIEIGVDDLGDLPVSRLEVTASLSSLQGTEPDVSAAEDTGEESVLEEMAPPAESHPLDAREGEVIREQLTEAEVFLKYGLTEKAVGELQSILRKVPDHVHAHQKLIAIYKSQKKTDKLVRQILKLAEIFKRQADLETYENLIDEARAIDPNHKFLKAIAEAAAKPPARGVSSLELDLGLMAPAQAPKVAARPSQEEIEISLESESPPPKAPVRVPVPEEEPQFLEVEVEETGAEPPAEVEIPPEAPFLREPVISRELEEPVEAPAEPEAPPAAAVEPQQEGLSIQISREEVAARDTVEEQLEEAEFYLSQELFGEAQKALQVLTANWPKDPRVGAFRTRLAAAAPAYAGGVEMAQPGALQELELDSFPPPEQALFKAGDETSSQLELANPLEAEVEEQDVAGEIEDTSSQPLVEIPAEAVQAEAPPMESAPFELAEAVSPDVPVTRAATAEPFEASLKDALAELTAPAKPKTKLKMSLQELLPEGTEAAAPAKSDEYYDLASELGAALDGLQAPEESLFEEDTKSPEEMSFEEVFAEFKKGVEKKVSEEDFSTHYNLGIAYKEMELLDEAIGEFQLAARSPQYFVECCSMLGLCFRQKGMGELAEKWYRKGIAAPGFADEIYVGLKYDLAEALVELDRNDEARELFKEVYANNANYRDIKSKVKQLR